MVKCALAKFGHGLNKKKTKYAEYIFIKNGRTLNYTNVSTYAHIHAGE